MTATTAPPLEEAVTRRLFTADEIIHLAESGFFGDDERLELIEGEIVRMTPIGDDHAFACDLLTNLMTRLAVDRGVALSVQNALRLNDSTVVQPDLMLLGRARLQSRRMADPSQVLLVVEVSGPTLRTDRAKKLPLYAAAGIPEAWIVNLREGIIEVHRDPNTDAGLYREFRICSKDESIAPLAFPDFSISVSEILP